MVAPDTVPKGNEVEAAVGKFEVPKANGVPDNDDVVVPPNPADVVVVVVGTNEKGAMPTLDELELSVVTKSEVVEGVGVLPKANNPPDGNAAGVVVAAVVVAKLDVGLLAIKASKDEVVLDPPPFSHGEVDVGATLALEPKSNVTDFRVFVAVVVGVIASCAVVTVAGKSGVSLFVVPCPNTVAKGDDCCGPLAAAVVDVSAPNLNNPVAGATAVVVTGVAEKPNEGAAVAEAVADVVIAAGKENGLTSLLVVVS